MACAIHGGGQVCTRQYFFIIKQSVKFSRRHLVLILVVEFYLFATCFADPTLSGEKEKKIMMMVSFPSPDIVYQFAELNPWTKRFLYSKNVCSLCKKVHFYYF